MKVMLTPPDLWGSTGYVSQADSGAQGATQTMYKVRGDRDLQYVLMIIFPQVRHSSEDGDPQEAAAENIILINRHRQVREG